MYINMVIYACIQQAVEIEAVVIFSKEAGVTIVAALYDMTGYAWNI